MADLENYLDINDQKFKSNIEGYEEKIINYKKLSNTIFTTLKSYEIDSNYSEWKDQISTLLNILNNKYNEKIPAIEDLLSLLKDSYKSLISPITHKRYILLGKTRVGKSNFGNAICNSDYFETSDGFKSMTKKHNTNNIIYQNITSEFIDTQGLDDTDNPFEVLPKLKDMISKIKWQYHGIVYLMKYQSIDSKYLKDVIEFLQNLFGPTILDKSLLVFTNSPSIRRFKSFDESKNLVINEFDSFNKDASKYLKMFKYIKFVDFVEKNNKMEQDEIHFIDKNQEKERNLILNELNTINMSISDSGPLRVSVLSHIRKVDIQFDLLEKMKNDIDNYEKSIKNKQSFTYFINSWFAYFTNTDKREFYK